MKDKDIEVIRRYYIDFAKRLLDIKDEDIEFYQNNHYKLGFFREDEIFRKHDLIKSIKSWNLPKLEKTVLLETKDSNFMSGYLDYREWKDISENTFDWFDSAGCSLAELEDGEIIAWYEIPENN